MTTRLVTITLPAFQALAASDPAEAGRLLGLPVPEEFATATDVWRFMVGLLEAHPENSGWLMSAVVDDDTIVGNAGFKGAPQDGLVELGYTIVPAHRRRGLALAAVDLLLERTRQAPDVDRVIARIRPDNVASVGVVTKAGFVPDGEFMNPRWGRQLQFTHPANAPRE